jgi:hypothetical protein
MFANKRSVLILAVSLLAFSPIELAAQRRPYIPPPRPSAPIPRATAPRAPARPSPRVKPSSPRPGGATPTAARATNAPRTNATVRKPTTTLRPRAAQANAASALPAAGSPLRVSAVEMAVAKNRLAATRQRLTTLRLARELADKKKAAERTPASAAAAATASARGSGASSASKGTLLSGTALGAGTLNRTAGSVPPEAARATVADWYGRHSHIKDVAPYVNATNFRKPVFLRRLKKGQRVAVWVARGTEPGIHFTTPDTNPENLLAIKTANREKQTFEAIEENAGRTWRVRAAHEPARTQRQP